MPKNEHAVTILITKFLFSTQYQVNPFFNEKIYFFLFYFLKHFTSLKNTCQSPPSLFLSSTCML